MVKHTLLSTTLFLAATLIPPAGLAEHHEESEHHHDAEHHDKAKHHDGEERRQERHHGKEHHGNKHRADHGPKRKSVENLSPALRALLKQEMQALQTGMVSAVPALVSGNLAEVAEIARKMEKSYILRQSITREQMHELHSSLPAPFLKQDAAFHYYAGMLAHVADRKKLELVNFYFSKLTESCVNCHSEHAMHKFPGFATNRSENGHDHH